MLKMNILGKMLNNLFTKKVYFEYFLMRAKCTIIYLRLTICIMLIDLF